MCFSHCQVYGEKGEGWYLGLIGVFCFVDVLVNYSLWAMVKKGNWIGLIRMSSISVMSKMTIRNIER